MIISKEKLCPSCDIQHGYYKETLDGEWILELCQECYYWLVERWGENK